MLILEMPFFVLLLMFLLVFVMMLICNCGSVSKNIGVVDVVFGVCYDFQKM